MRMIYFKMKLNKSQKERLVSKLWDSGMIIQSKSLDQSDHEGITYERLQSLFIEGYRFQLFGEVVHIINIKGTWISQEVMDELMEHYKYITNTK